MFSGFHGRTNFSKSRIGREVLSSHNANAGDIETRNNEYLFCISQSKLNENNDDTFLDITQSATNNNASNKINAIPIKSETIVRIFLKKINLNYENDELENWIYFMFILFIVTLITISLCLIAKYFVIKS
jgi:hypothetical protein